MTGRYVHHLDAVLTAATDMVAGTNAGVMTQPTKKAKANLREENE